MTITKKTQGSALTIALEGRLDTTTAPELEAELNAALDGVTELTIDMEQLLYLSSAGLRAGAHDGDPRVQRDHGGL